MKTSTEALADMAMHYEVSQFLVKEVRLLDERKFDDWLGLIAPDMHYYAPVRLARMPREESKEFAAPGGGAHFDDTKEDLVQRVRKVQTGRAWSEVPSSRSRHLITNVEIEDIDQTELRVRSNFLVYRTRGRTYEDTYVGVRHDVLRRRSSEFGDFEISRRTIHLDQTILLGTNLSVLL